MKIRIAKLLIYSERTSRDIDFGSNKRLMGSSVLVHAGITTGLDPMDNQERRALWKEKKKLYDEIDAALLKERQSHPLYL
jgi:hypothetical protein